MIEHGECDFVHDIAAPLPLEIICDMMGIPPEDYARGFKWTNTILGAGDPEFTSSYEDLMGQSLEMFMYAQALGEDRKANPQDDITSIMMAAEVDGERVVFNAQKEIVLRCARHVHRQTGQKHLCLAGGVALNCVANGRLLREGPFEEIWIQPAAGDAGRGGGGAGPRPARRQCQRTAFHR